MLPCKAGGGEGISLPLKSRGSVPAWVLLSCPCVLPSRLGLTTLSSWGERLHRLEMLGKGAAQASRGFGSEPSLSTAPALRFRCNLGNVVQVVPSASVSPPAFPCAHPPSQDGVSMILCCKALGSPKGNAQGGGWRLLLAVHLVSLGLAFRPLILTYLEDTQIFLQTNF